MSSNKKLPVILLTGFLGSGKTTFLNRLLRRGEFSNSLVIINEFGAVSIDHFLVEESTDTVFELSNGCVCCSVRSDLVETLLEQDFTKFDRIFIETTGIANPLPVFQALTSDPELMKRLQPATILTVIDATQAKEILKEYSEVQRQIAIADFILLSKTDLVSQDTTLENDLVWINPTASIRNATDDFDPRDFSEQPTIKPSISESTEGHTNYQSIVLKSDRRLPASDFYGMLNLIVNRLGPGLLRIKGFALIEEQEYPVVIQVSGQTIHTALPTSEQVPMETRLVIVTAQSDPAPAKDIFDGFNGSPSLDTADRDALLDNPLTVPGAGL